MRTVEFNPLSISSLKAAVKQLEDEQKLLKANTWRFAKDVAEYARDEAQVGFDMAENAGPDPDVHVFLDDKTEGNRTEYTVKARGTQTWFIEFGTGYLSNDNWRERGELEGDPIGEHGSYGRHRGEDPTGWFYRRDYQGSAPLPAGTGPSYLTGKGHLMHTVGQHAQSPLWNAKNRARNEFERIAREVFDD